MLRVLGLSVVDRGFESNPGITKDYEIGIFCFYAKHAALRRNCKDRMARHQDNVVRVERHVYLRFIVSVILHYKNPT